MINKINCYDLEYAHYQEPMKETFEITSSIWNIVSPSPWVVDSTGTIITKYTGSDTIINIPYSINGIIITKIEATTTGTVFINSINIISINFPSNSQIHTIGYFAFYDCRKLQNIILPISVTIIGDYAFCFCGILVESFSINLNNIIKIGIAAFFNSKISYLKFSSNITVIKSTCFASCFHIIELEIPYNIKTNEINAFKGCAN
jgi:hypothetical protein